MTTTPFPSSPPDGRGAGATWVAATGAFLLLAAAAVFVAFRWDQLPEGAKVALVGGLTGAFLAGGRALRRSLPATGDALFHLGALLIPIDVAALSLRLDLGWQQLLLVEGLVGVVTLGALAVASRSVVLKGAAATAAVVLAGGVAAVTPLPAPLILAAAAVAASQLGRRRSTIAWAAVAGLAPVLGAAGVVAGRLLDDVGGGFLDILGRSGPEVLEELGLAGRSAALVAVASGAIAAAVLGREASRRRDLALVALAGACLTSGAATTWVNAAPSREMTFLAGAGLFVIVQAGALLGRRDAFWRRPGDAVGLAAEVVAAVVATPVAFAQLLLAPLVEEGGLFSDGTGWRPEPPAAVAWALLACGWLLASWRRLGLSGPAEREALGLSGAAEREAPGTSGPAEREAPGPSGPAERLAPLAALRGAVADDRFVVFLAAAAGASLVVASASTIVIAAGMVVLAAGFAASRGIGATVVGAAAAVWAPLLVGPSHPLASLPVGLAAAGVLGAAALAWRQRGDGWVTAELAAGGSILAFCSCAIASSVIVLPLAMGAAVAAAWALAMLVERASPLAGHVVRGTMLVGLVGALTGTAADALPVAAMVTLLFALDSVRHDEPLVALGTSLAVQVVVSASALAAGGEPATVGVVLCAAAAIWGGLSALYPERWRLPFVAAAGVAMVVGPLMAAGDAARFAESLLLTGALAVGAGMVLRSRVVGHVGGAVAVLGLGLHLAVDGVTALDAFAAPVAVQLIVAGWQMRRQPSGAAAADRLSSWVAYGPAIALLGGAALAERLSGGGAWHGLTAGAVGAAAVVAGGWRRLAGPLFLGTGLVATVTIVESLATLAGVPTWAWLAAGGVTLLTTGIVLERSATSPLEAGRRLVDVVDERFS